MVVGIQRKRSKGWRKPEGSVIVDRTSVWGNPHKIGDDCRNAETAVLRFEQDLIGLVLKDRKGTPMLNRIGELRGKDLVCFCAIGSPCHRNVLLHYANLRGDGGRW